MSDTTGSIVLAVGPETSAEAVDTAFDLAAERGLSLLAVRTWHDTDLPLGGWLGAESTARWDAAHEQARRELEGALEHARAAHPAVHVVTIVVDDGLVAFLTALSTRAKLMVLGRSTRPGHAESRTVAPVDVLVHHAACPVLVVPPARQPARAPAPTFAVTGG
jgi:universal stress protein family protein